MTMVEFDTKINSQAISVRLSSQYLYSGIFIVSLLATSLACTFFSWSYNYYYRDLWHCVCRHNHSHECYFSQHNYDRPTGRGGHMGSPSPTIQSQRQLFNFEIVQPLCCSSDYPVFKNPCAIIWHTQSHTNDFYNMVLYQAQCRLPLREGGRNNKFHKL